MKLILIIAFRVKVTIEDQIYLLAIVNQDFTIMEHQIVRYVTQNVKHAHQLLLTVKNAKGNYI